MRLSLELILEQIQDVCLPVVSMWNGENPSFTRPALFTAATPPKDSGVLYVGTLSELLLLPAVQTEGYVFCVFGSLEDFTRAQREHRCTMLYFVDDADIATCFNLLHDLFARFDGWDREIDRLLYGKGSLQELLEASEAFFDNPIYIWDAAFRIQAFTRSIRAEHPLLKSFEETGRVPQHILSQLTRTRDGLMYNIENYVTMQLHYPPSVANVPLALKVFMSGQKTVLVLANYFVNTSPTIGRMEMLQRLIEKLEEYVANHYPKSQFKTILYEPFIVELVEGALHTEEEIRDRLHLINLPYEMKYRIYYIAAQAQTASLMSYLRHNCKTYLPYAKIIYYKQGVLILDQEGKENMASAESESGYASGRDALAKINAVCGISSAFYNLGQARVAYLQAMAAFDLGKALDPGKTVYFYRDYYLYHILDICSKYPEMDLGQLYFNRLDLLEKSDWETKNDNMRLLEIYLRNNRNITNTAREMHLHRNSVIYRLERISELLRAPLDDPDVQMRLLISFQIHRLYTIRGGKP